MLVHTRTHVSIVHAASISTYGVAHEANGIARCQPSEPTREASTEMDESGK